jgi:hypothetical protein
MNKIVRQHYPAALLPKELQGDVDPKSAVTITIEVEPQEPGGTMTLEQILAARRPPFRSADEIDEDIRRSRAEWDE